MKYDKFNGLLVKLKLLVVPMIETYYLLENDIDAIPKRAIIKSKIHKEAWAEGIVIRPYTGATYKSIQHEYMSSGRVSFKAINP